MAPVADVVSMLNKRDNTYCDYYGCYSSTWDNWGRWVALVVIILFFVIIAFLFSRRRRRQGRAPMYGTGWIPYTGHPNNQNKPPGYGDPNFHPPPPYQNNQATGTTFNSNEGYYAGHGAQPAGGSYELQQPSSSYQPQRGGDTVYDAPAGPPPAKGLWGTNDSHVVR